MSAHIPHRRVAVLGQIHGEIATSLPPWPILEVVASSFARMESMSELSIKLVEVKLCKTYTKLWGSVRNFPKTFARTKL